MDEGSNMEKFFNKMSDILLIIILIGLSIFAFTSVFIQHSIFLSIISIFSIFVWIWGWKGGNY